MLEQTTYSIRRLDPEVKQQIATIAENAEMGMWPMSERLEALKSIIDEHPELDDVFFIFFLVQIFGLTPAFYQEYQDILRDEFTELKNFRNHGVREALRLKKDITQTKIMDRMSDNMKEYYEKEKKDMGCRLALELQYLEKYAKIQKYIDVPLIEKVSKEETLSDIKPAEDYTTLLKELQTRAED